MNAILKTTAFAALFALTAGAAQAEPSCARGVGHHATAHRHHHHHCAAYAGHHHGGHAMRLGAAPRYHHGARDARPLAMADAAPVVPRLYVNQGPTLSGPAVQITERVYDDRPVTPYYPYIRAADLDAGARAPRDADRPAGPGIAHADAVIRTISPNRVDIELYRKD